MRTGCSRHLLDCHFIKRLPLKVAAIRSLDLVLARLMSHTSSSIIGLMISTLWLGTCAADAMGPEGMWKREDGAGGVRIERCGGSLCGRIVWLRDAAGPGRIGDRVFYDMNRAGTDRWSGSAHNPEDGRDYDGTMTLSGEILVTQGCAFGGMICKTVRFVRQR